MLTPSANPETPKPLNPEQNHRTLRSSVIIESKEFRVYRV